MIAVLDEQRAVEHRPGRLGDEALGAERLPAFFGKMRHHRGEKPHEDLGRLAERRAELRRAASARVGEERLKRVRELVDLRHRDVEAEALDGLLDRGERAVRGLANGERFRRVLDGAAVRLRVAVADRVGDFTDEAPHPLHEARRALDAFLGPDHVALRRRVGEHEPARRIGAEARDDVVGIDRVLPRLRHLLDRADRDRRAGRAMDGAPCAAVMLDPDVGRQHP